MSQLFLFEDSDDEEVVIDDTVSDDNTDTKVCRICGLEKSINDFRLDRGALYSKCKDCSKEYNKNLTNVKKNAPPKPEDNKCECCGIDVTQWFCDHYPESEIFRGWVCRNCNTAAGLVGDTYKGAAKLLNYLYARKNKPE